MAAAATNTAPGAAPAPATQLTIEAVTASTAVIRAIVSPRVDGTSNATRPMPHVTHAAAAAVARTAVERPSSASPIDQIPAAATSNHAIRGPHNPVTADSALDGDDRIPPHLPIGRPHRQ